MARPIRYAWLQLTHEKLKLLAAVLGITFAVILVFMQLGFRTALFDSAVRLHRSMKYQLMMLSPRTVYLAHPESFARSRLYQVVGVDGVKSIAPVYVSLAQFYYRKTPKTYRMILVLGVPPADDTFSLAGVSQYLKRLTQPDTIIMDRHSRAEFRPVVTDFLKGEPTQLQLNQRTVNVIGLYSLGTSFGIDASVLTTDLNFLRIFPNHYKGDIELGLIQLEPDADPQAVRKKIEAFLPRDVLLLTKPEFVQREVDYWNGSTPIGYVFTLGAVIGVIVGLIIVYQILFSDVQGHLAEYATLKAMGYTGGYLKRLVISESLFLSILGFVPGMGLSMYLYTRAALATQLPMEMTVERAAIVLAATVIMCASSGLLAIRKLDSLDPAEVF